jgi:hypothetical protein
MAAPISRGLAIINALVGGVPTNVSVWANISPQTAAVTQKWDLETVKSSNGTTVSRQARDHQFDKKVTFKPTATTLAAAKSATVFLAPLATLTFAGSDASDFDGNWQLDTGADIQIKNDATAEYSFSCNKLADSGDNALIQTIPS